MPTSRKVEIFTHERAGRLLAGLSVLATVALGFFHHPLWLLLTAATAINLVISGIADRCAVKSLLVRLGIPGERDVGRAEGLATGAKQTPPAVFRRTVRPSKVPLN